MSSRRSSVQGLATVALDPSVLTLTYPSARPELRVSRTNLRRSSWTLSNARSASAMARLRISSSMRTLLGSVRSPRGSATRSSRFSLFFISASGRGCLR